MKKIKIIALILVMFLLSGCSGIYNVSIDENQFVTEDATFNLDKSVYAKDNITWLLELYGVSTDDYKLVETDDDIKLTFKKTYTNIDDYFVNSILYKQLFDNVDYTTDNEVVKIDTTSKMLLNTSHMDTSNLVNNYDVNILNINLKIANKVYNSNADEINDNIYTWTIDKNTTSKRISIKFDKNNNSKNRLYYLVLVAIGVVILGSLIVVFVKFRRRQKL